MDASDERGSHFLGDLDDPWVASLAASLPRGVACVPVPHGLPRPWPEDIRASGSVILHRTWLDSADADRVAALRSRPEPPRVLLCTGLLPRYYQLEQWMPLVDRVVPETIMPELLARWLRPARTWSGLDSPPRSARPTIAVVSTIHELRQVLVESIRRAGYPAISTRAWSDVPPGVTTVWDVPTLDSAWEKRLSEEARQRSVLAVTGFLDRSLVTRLRDAGARAWIDLPCDPDDLIGLIDAIERRAQALRRHEAHPGTSPPHRGPEPPSAPGEFPRRAALGTTGPQAAGAAPEVA